MATAAAEKPLLGNPLLGNDRRSGTVAVHDVQVYQTVPQVEQQQVALLPPDALRKSVFDAYLLTIFAGYLGAHHFYLRRYFFGLLYMFTGGLFFVGWIFDWFRIPFLVKEANQEIAQEFLPRTEKSPPKKRLDDAYILSFPLGFLGLHHFYLRRHFFGVCYLFTLGLGIGWIIDWCRMPFLVKKVNLEISKGTPSFLVRKSVLDAYMLAFPLGFLGLHRFYLKQPGWGILYFCTLGLFGIGWLIDLIRMPFLVRKFNEGIEFTEQRGRAAATLVPGTIQTGIISPSGTLEGGVIIPPEANSNYQSRPHQGAVAGGYGAMGRQPLPPQADFAPPPPSQPGDVPPPMPPPYSEVATEMANEVANEHQSQPSAPPKEV